MSKFRCPFCQSEIVGDTLVGDTPTPPGFDFDAPGVGKLTAAPHLAPTPYSTATRSPAFSSPTVSLPSDSAIVSFERRRPVRTTSIESDVIVPFLQSLVFSVVAGIGGYLASSLFRYEKPVAAGLASLATGFGLSWVVFTIAAHRAIWETEVVWREESEPIAGNTTSNPPDTNKIVSPIRIEVTDPTHTWYKYTNLRIPSDKLTRVAETVLSNTPFTRRNLSHIITSDEYTELIDQMLEAGFLVMRGDGITAGVELTAAGRAVFRKIAEKADKGE